MNTLSNKVIKYFFHYKNLAKIQKLDIKINKNKKLLENLYTFS
jgi:hypothetical protein